MAPMRDRDHDAALAPRFVLAFGLAWGLLAAGVPPLFSYPLAIAFGLCGLRQS